MTLPSPKSLISLACQGMVRRTVAILGGVSPACRSALRCWPGRLRLCTDRDFLPGIPRTRITGPRQLPLDMPYVGMIWALHIDYLG